MYHGPKSRAKWDIYLSTAHQLYSEVPTLICTEFYTHEVYLEEKYTSCYPFEAMVIEICYMKTLHILIADVESTGHLNRLKRSSLKLGVMIYVQTKKSPLEFNGYGCYCGFGGGGKPVDAIDE